MLFIVAFIGLVFASSQDATISEESAATAVHASLRHLERDLTADEMVYPICEDEQCSLWDESCKCATKICSKIQFCQLEDGTQECHTILRIWWVGSLAGSIVLWLICCLLCCFCQECCCCLCPRRRDRANYGSRD
eukprot:GEMP01042879.1.p1 GENE.GEMP01042879.1~~GEMP01042879.1.p1  ORF type:complete len:135 (+),score=12.29 GEMP01042879.1:180-584(+)